MDVYGYDFDGVVSIGITPSSINDVIITGRCLDDNEKVIKELSRRNIQNTVYYKPILLEHTTYHTIENRIQSGKHKADTILKLREQNINVIRFFEDDEVQIETIKIKIPELEIIKITSNLVRK
jgi:hypothetical protein